MQGIVDQAGRALVDIELAPEDGVSYFRTTAWIDTGFSGDIVLPDALIERLGLSISGTVTAILADGSTRVMTTHTCILLWFGQTRRLEVVANAGNHPLLGIGLLLDRTMHIDYPGKAVVVM